VFRSVENERHKQRCGAEKENGFGRSRAVQRCDGLSAGLDRHAVAKTCRVIGAFRMCSNGASRKALRSTFAMLKMNEENS
jgi:hypothetical protein